MNNGFSKDTYVLILAGGAGTRFWPKSRSNFPKQFIDILGIGKSLLQLTYERFSKVCPDENIFILSNEQYSSLIFEQLSGLQENNLIAEPSRNNTAPCIAYGSFKISQLNAQANIIVAPSDHLILDESVFIEKVQQALDYASNRDVLVTLGINPTRPDTGYGYINYNKILEGDVHRVIKFLEKPNLEKAKEFVVSGDYLWNAGIFIWSAKAILSSLAKYSPVMFSLFEQGKSCYNTSDEQLFISENYPLSENISIDYAIMEMADNVYTIPGEFGWSDLGTWSSLYEIVKKDENNNAFSGHGANLSNTTNCMIQVPKDKIVVLKGLDNFIVIDDGNVLLIYPKANEQEIKGVSQTVISTFGEEFA